MLETVQIQLSGVWAALMLIYLLGDVLRIFSGDFQKEMSQKHMPEGGFTQGMYLGIAVLMLLPILMVVLTLFLPRPVNRWANIIVAGFFLIFNLIGLPGYPSAYDKFLLAVSLVFNGLTIWLAWSWA